MTLPLLGERAGVRASDKQTSRFALAARSIEEHRSHFPRRLGWAAPFQLQSARMTNVAGPIDFVPRMFEFLSVRCQQIEFLPPALRENRVAGVAIARLDAALAVGRRVLAVATAEAAQPLLVPD